MLETSNMARKYTSICSFRKYIFQSLAPLILLMSPFFLQKISIFCPKKYHYSKQQCESCVRDFLVLLSVFIRQRVTVTKKKGFADSVSGIRSPDCSKLAKKSKSDNDGNIFRHDVIVKFFLTFHVNIVTGPEIITIFFYKGLTRNPEIGNTPV